MQLVFQFIFNALPLLMLGPVYTSVCTFRIRRRKKKKKKSNKCNVSNHNIKKPSPKALQYAYPIAALLFSKIEPAQQRLNLQSTLKLKIYIIPQILCAPSVLLHPA